MMTVYCVALVGLASASTSFATGLATCDSGPQETWQPQAKLEQQLACFHPRTLAPVPTKPKKE